MIQESTYRELVSFERIDPGTQLARYSVQSKEQDTGCEKADEGERSLHV